MNKELFAQIQDKTLVPYLHNFETHWFMQDNDPKRTWLYDLADFHYINWWKTLLEWPDFNPIKKSLFEGR